MAEIFDRLIELAFSRYGLAVVVALIISWAGTQFIKKQAHLAGLNAAIIAFILGTLPAFFLWPKYNVVAVFVALAVGLASPIAYKVTITVVGKRWPEIAQHLSGDEPGAKRKPKP